MGAESNRIQLRYARNTGTWGSTVANGPATTELRLTGESLGHRKATEVSREIRSDRQRTALLETAIAAEGAVNFELTWSTFEGLFENALRNSISSTTVANASVTVSAGGVSCTAANYSSFAAGQFVRIDASGFSIDNAVAQISTVATTTLTFTGTTLIASIGSVNITGRSLTNGTSKTDYFMEVGFSDITAVKYFTGMAANGMSLNVAAGQIVTGALNFMGKQGFNASTTVASTVVTSAGTDTPMTAAANIGSVFEGGSIVSTAIQSLTLNVNNNMRARPQVGSKPSAQHGDGTVDVTGQLNVYFEDISLYKKFMDHTSTSLSFRFTDDNSNVIVITLPKLHFSGGDPNATGENADVFLPLDFTAFRDATTGKTIRMDFLPI